MLSLSLLVSLAIAGIDAHSWMTCPPSFVPTTSRGGHRGTLCENDGANAPVTNVEAGDRLKVGWTSNNHAGGFVRISLVSINEDYFSEKVAKANIMKYACYGHDNRFPSKSRTGDCTHPCNARKGCQYQNHVGDTERFDTTIGIPTNLKDGIYILQLALLVGNDGSPYFSCAKLSITGGNTNLKNCNPSGVPPVRYKCFKSNGPTLEEKDLIGVRGPFCYHLDGTRGTVDDNIRDVPINVECDPRMSCSASINADICEEEPAMTKIIWRDQDRVQDHCYVYNTVPPLPPTCEDKEKNGDEENVDCGGEKCKPCPPPVEIDDPYVTDITQSGNAWQGGAIINIEVVLKNDIPRNTCWQLKTQFGCPILANTVWHHGQQIKIGKKISNFLEFELSEGSTVEFKANSTVRVSFDAKNPCSAGSNTMDDGQCDAFCSEWSPERVQFNRVEFNVFDNPKACTFDRSFLENESKK